MYKCIFQGRLDFRNESSYDKAIAQYEQRMETYYKNEVVFKLEDVFDDEELQVVIPRTVINITTKYWKNTVSLLEYISQFALSGRIDAWMVEQGKILNKVSLEPEGDKAAIVAYKQGKSLAEKEGEEIKAIESLTVAIEKFDKHSQAYERRGYINYKLANNRDARYDFDKSIVIDPNNAIAYFGRALLSIREEKFEEAISDLDMTTKKSIALQGLFWRARRIKGEIHLQLEQWEEAAREFKFYSARNFQDGDPNKDYLPEVRNNYILALINAGEEKTALAFIDGLLDDGPELLEKSKGDILTNRGIIKQKLGIKGFKKDLEEASALGVDKAKELLETLS